MIPKFRVWDKDERAMLDVHGINFDAHGIWTNELIDDESDGNFIFLDDVELMQSTGLKDKNGTEIYEGDIVQHSEKPNPCFSYLFKVIQARTGEWRLDNFRCGTVLAFSNQDELEVLGNIYENPELLEG